MRTTGQAEQNDRVLCTQITLNTAHVLMLSARCPCCMRTQMDKDGPEPGGGLSPLTRPSRPQRASLFPLNKQPAALAVRRRE